jgi:hypothetical protein
LSQVLVAHICNLATQEAEIRRIAVQSQPGQIMSPYLEKPITKKGAGEAAQGVGPEFKH